MRNLSVIAALASVLAVPVVEAATATGTLTVQATVAASCTVNTSSTGTTTNALLNFGTVSSFADNVDASTSTNSGTKVGVLCNKGTAWTLIMNGGLNISGTQRRMSGGTTEYIPYNLYSDTGRTTLIGINTVALNAVGDGTQQTYDIYGRIPSGSTLPSVGKYSDTVTLTLTY